MWGHPRELNSEHPEFVAVQSAQKRVNDLCLYNAFEGIYAVPSGRSICQKFVHDCFRYITGESFKVLFGKQPCKLNDGKQMGHMKRETCWKHILSGNCWPDIESIELRNSNEEFKKD